MGKWILYAATVSLLSFSSCSLILNQPVQSVSLITKGDIALKRVDTIPVNAAEKHTLRVRRGECVDLYFRLPDSTLRRYHLRSRIRPMYWAGNLVTFMGAGYIVDLFTKKRLGLPEKNYFEFDVKKNRIVSYRQELPERGTFSAGLGWSFMNAYNNLYHAYQGTGSLSGALFSAAYHFRSGYSFDFHAGLAKAGSIQERRHSRFWYRRSSDTVITSRTENHWFMLSVTRHFRNRFFVGAGAAVTPMNHYQVDHYRWVIPVIAGNDTLREERFSSDMIRSDRFVKLGPVFRFGVDCGKYWQVGMNWMMMVTDLSRRQDVGMAHFVNFHVTFHPWQKVLGSRDKRAP